MSAKLTETAWLDAHCEVSFAELARLSGLTEAELRELVEYGALVPNNPRESQWTFSGVCVATSEPRTACARALTSIPMPCRWRWASSSAYMRSKRDLRALRAQLPQRTP